jgi:hypothetical protein
VHLVLSEARILHSLLRPCHLEIRTIESIPSYCAAPRLLQKQSNSFLLCSLAVVARTDSCIYASPEDEATPNDLSRNNRLPSDAKEWGLVWIIWRVGKDQLYSNCRKQRAAVSRALDSTFVTPLDRQAVRPDQRQSKLHKSKVHFGGRKLHLTGGISKHTRRCIYKSKRQRSYKTSKAKGLCERGTKSQLCHRWTC